jgi:hypothetical protein
MFEKIGQAAERAAIAVSRRSFLSHVGKGTLVLAGSLAGLFALSSTAEASNPRYKCCLYTSGRFCWPASIPCPSRSGCGNLSSSFYTDIRCTGCVRTGC